MKLRIRPRAFLLVLVSCCSVAAFAVSATGEIGEPGGQEKNCSQKKVRFNNMANCGETVNDCGWPVDGECPEEAQYIQISEGDKPQKDCNGGDPQPTHNCRTKNGSCGSRYGCRYQINNGLPVCVKDLETEQDIPFETAWDASAPGAEGSKPCFVSNKKEEIDP